MVNTAGVPVQAPPPFRVDVFPDARGVRVVPIGELDLATAATLSHRLEEMLEGGETEIVLDLRDLAFMDSTGLHLVITWDERAKREGFDLKLVQGGAEISRLFEITKLTDRLQFVTANGQDAAPG